MKLLPLVSIAFAASAPGFSADHPPLASLLMLNGSIIDGTLGIFGASVSHTTRGPEDEPLFTSGDTFTHSPVHTTYPDLSNGVWDDSFGPEGLNGHVRAIALSGEYIYAGGQFTQAGGSQISYIARWNGSSWENLGDGVNGTVYALAVSGSDVYAGGAFTQAGDVQADHIALWNGTSWTSLGSGTNHAVLSIEVTDAYLYAGGSFSQAGGNPANGIARWDGSSWSVLGDGLSDCVRAMAMSDSGLYVGGDFIQAGGKPSFHIARWLGEEMTIEQPPEETAPSLGLSRNPVTAGVYLSFTCFSSSPVTFSVHDMAGRVVRMQDLGILSLGHHSHYWDGCDGKGAPLASGVYLIGLFSNEFQAATRAVIIR